MFDNWADMNEPSPPSTKDILKSHHAGMRMKGLSGKPKRKLLKTDKLLSLCVYTFKSVYKEGVVGGNKSELFLSSYRTVVEKVNNKISSVQANE